MRPSYTIDATYVAGGVAGRAFKIDEHGTILMETEPGALTWADVEP
jgi:hypothetical protein